MITLPEDDDGGAEIRRSWRQVTRKEKVYSYTCTLNCPMLMWTTGEIRPKEGVPSEKAETHQSGGLKRETFKHHRLGASIRAALAF